MSKLLWKQQKTIRAQLLSQPQLVAVMLEQGAKLQAIYHALGQPGSYSRFTRMIHQLNTEGAFKPPRRAASKAHAAVAERPAVGVAPTPLTRFDPNADPDNLY